MSVKGDEIHEALSKAIYREIGAHDFYKAIAVKIDNTEGKRKFEQIAEDERIHREKLESWYERLYAEEFVTRKEELEESEIKGTELSERSGAIKVLDIAIEAELKANEFYSEQAKKVDKSELRDLYLKLAAEEEGHYNLLLAEKNALIGGFYWYDMDSTSFMED